MIEPVVLAWATPGTVNARFMDSVLRTVLAGQSAVTQGLREDNPVRGYFFIESGPRIASARNNLVRLFLESESFSDVEWLLMLDSDMTFNELALPALFENVRNEDGAITRPIVGGLCFGGGHVSMFPTMYRLVDPAENDGNPVAIVTDYQKGASVEVDATGAAFLLIHRGVLEEMKERYEEPSPWFAESVYKGQEFGEDWTFCIRARTMGLPIYVNTSAKTGHVKPVVLDEGAWDQRHNRTQSVPGLWVPDAKVIPMNREQRRAVVKAR